MNRKTASFLGIFIACMAVFSCATPPESGDLLGLDQAIAAAAEQLGSDLARQTVAVIAFTSPSAALSDYVTEELSRHLVNSRAVTVVNRKELDLVRGELQFQLSGEVGDESARSIGKMLGAEAVVSGSLTDLDNAYRFGVKALDVESAAIKSAPAFDIARRDSRLAYLLDEAVVRRESAAAQPVQAAPVRPAPEPAPQPAAPPVRPVPANMVRIQGGTFQMGSPASEAGRDDDETRHQVTVGSFYMGKYEVSQKEWREVMGNNPSNFKGDNLPVEQVSWYDAVEFCNQLSQKEGLTPAYTIVKDRSDPNNTNPNDTLRWQVTWNRNASGYRLPTEAEWEYACRAGTATPFNTGNNISANIANYDGNYPYNNGAKGVYREKTVAVGSFPPNAWGLYDMHGNVWEWCWDWHGSYSSGAQVDPAGPSTGAVRVLRGGSWYSFAVYLRSAIRDYFTPSNRGIDVGFRVVRP